MSVERVPIAQYHLRIRASANGRPERAAFLCPRCGHVATLGDFRALGAEPGRAAQECIGRVQGSTVGCDWAAFGLLGTLAGGVLVVTEEGVEVPCFEVVYHAEDLEERPAYLPPPLDIVEDRTPEQLAADGDLR